MKFAGILVDYISRRPCVAYWCSDYGREYLFFGHFAVSRRDTGSLPEWWDSDDKEEYLEYHGDFSAFIKYEYKLEYDGQPCNHPGISVKKIFSLANKRHYELLKAERLQGIGRQEIDQARTDEEYKARVAARLEAEEGFALAKAAEEERIKMIERQKPAHHIPELKTELANFKFKGGRLVSYECADGAYALSFIKLDEACNLTYKINLLKDNQLSWNIEISNAAQIRFANFEKKAKRQAEEEGRDYYSPFESEFFLEYAERTGADEKWWFDTVMQMRDYGYAKGTGKIIMIEYYDARGKWHKMTASKLLERAKAP